MDGSNPWVFLGNEVKRAKQGKRSFNGKRQVGDGQRPKNLVPWVTWTENRWPNCAAKNHRQVNGSVK